MMQFKIKAVSQLALRFILKQSARKQQCYHVSLQNTSPSPGAQSANWQEQGRNYWGGLGGCFTPPILKNSISQGKAEGISSSRRAKEIRNQVSQNILIYFTFLSNRKHMLVFPICCGIVK